MIKLSEEKMNKEDYANYTLSMTLNKNLVSHGFKGVLDAIYFWLYPKKSLKATMSFFGKGTFEIANPSFVEEEIKK